MSTVCDFCGKPEWQVDLLLRSNDGRHHICDVCAEQAHAMVAQRMTEQQAAERPEDAESGEGER